MNSNYRNISTVYWCCLGHVNEDGFHRHYYSGYGSEDVLLQVPCAGHYWSEVIELMCGDSEFSPFLIHYTSLNNYELANKIKVNE